MIRKLHSVAASGPAPDHIAIPARAALEHALATGARTVLIAWETDASNKDDTCIPYATIPASRGLAEGIIGLLASKIFRGSSS